MPEPSEVFDTQAFVQSWCPPTGKTKSRAGTCSYVTQIRADEMPEPEHVQTNPADMRIMNSLPRATAEITREFFHFAITLLKEKPGKKRIHQALTDRIPQFTGKMPV